MKSLLSGPVFTADLAQELRTRVPGGSRQGPPLAGRHSAGLCGTCGSEGVALGFQLRLAGLFLFSSYSLFTRDIPLRIRACDHVPLCP